ncbi:Putative purine nucleoside phosphorylase [Desulfonema limicola]|uniref:Uridine phosphorylase n=1 Tax=Desulfonema limicola TaxID=45656 RepID=A0A975GJI0_9BACT|nr:nucleoside phosphorylase [Desulfonema limicola]QTA83053.1 Putative purine nucleoside phosphorylase [Desulfonema limicola]
MKRLDAIINPLRGKNSPDPGKLLLMITSGPDLKFLSNFMNPLKPPVSFMMSQIYIQDTRTPGFCLAGPVTGSPYAVLLMENLMAWGVRDVLYFGWCGSISENIETGDIILPAAAIIDEGTSVGYEKHSGEIVYPSGDINQNIKTILNDRKIDYHEGRIWTTDAIFRETPEKVKYFQEKKALAVEMELSALFTAAEFRGINMGAVLVVSDELASFTWKPGFNDKRFKQSRMAGAEVIKDYVSRFCKTRD